MDRPFITGANLPWLNYGGDFGANLWRPDGGIGEDAARRRIDAVFGQLRASGHQCVRWFLLCDGRAGIRFDANGCPIGLDPFVLSDVDVALELAARHGIQIMFVLLDFHWCRPASHCNGVQVCGRSGVLANERMRGALLDRIFAPLLQHCGSHPSIYAWDIVNEPEWITTIRPADVRRFIRESVDLVHSLTTHAATVGSAGTRWCRRYMDMGLDLYQVHWYDELAGQPPLSTPIDTLGFDRAVILGEFPTRQSQFAPQEIVRIAQDAGYAAAFYWSALSHDRFSAAEVKEMYSHSHGS